MTDPQRLACALLEATVDIVGSLGEHRGRVERQLLSVATAVVRTLAPREAEAAWMGAAANAITTAAAAGQPFTSDEVWALLDTQHPGLAPPDPRAMGVAFARIQRRGLIAPTPATRRSTRRTNHGRPIRVWHPTEGDTT